MWVVPGLMVRNETSVEARSGDQRGPPLADEFTLAGGSRVGEANQNLYKKIGSQFADRHGRKVCF
ncbi:hypothetical protein LINGRAHAP2_LOCUS5609 [Linum grandiflorum]